LSDWETAYALTTAWDIVLKAWLPQVPDSFLGDDFLLPPVPQLLPEVRHVPLPPDIDPRLYEMLVARYGPAGFSIMESPAAYEKRMADFEVEIETSKKELAENPNVLDKYKKVADEKIKEFEELKQHIETLENLGSESAFVMLPEQSQQD
jgi:hypothetical protein